MAKKRVLNVGGNSKDIPLPPQYKTYEQLWLDIDPSVEPDLCMDARELSTLEPAQFDAIYCSHNLEHYFRHDVSKVLGGFYHVLNEDGFAQILVPDIRELMKLVAANGWEMDTVLNEGHLGPVTVLDVLYGYGAEIERSGVDFFAHKTGFSRRSLCNALIAAGFSTVYIQPGPIEIAALAFKDKVDPLVMARFKLPLDTVPSMTK